VDRSGYAARMQAPAAPAIAGTNAVWPLAVILPAAWASAPGWGPHGCYGFPDTVKLFPE
jgi:hypothetical protein